MQYAHYFLIFQISQFQFSRIDIKAGVHYIRSLRSHLIQHWEASRRSTSKSGGQLCPGLTKWFCSYYKLWYRRRDSFCRDIKSGWYSRYANHIVIEESSSFKVSTNLSFTLIKILAIYFLLKNYTSVSYFILNNNKISISIINFPKHYLSND